MTILQQITSPPQASAEVVVNENFASMESLAVYAMRPAVTTGLTWGCYGGRWGGFSVAEGTLTLTDDSTNYVVVKISDGTISAATASTNWDNTTDYKRVYKITVASTLVTATEDHRAGPGGVHGGAGAAAPAGSPVEARTGTAVDLESSDSSLYLRFTNAAAKTYTVRPDATEALGDTFEVNGRNVGAADLTITAGSGVTINAPAGGTLVIPQGGTFTLKRAAADEFDLIGVTVAA